MTERFGFDADENGDIKFMTFETDFIVANFEHYMELVQEVGRIMLDYPGVMPILKLNYDKP